MGISRRGGIGITRLRAAAVVVSLAASTVMVSLAEATHQGVEHNVVEGVVTSRGTPVAGAFVSKSPAWYQDFTRTDTQGRYTLTFENIDRNPDGTITIEVEPPGCWNGASSAVPWDYLAPAIADFELTRQVNAGDYACNFADFNWVPGTTQLSIPDRNPGACGGGEFPGNEMLNDYLDVALPFTVSFYGVEYSNVRINPTGWLGFELSGEPDCSWPETIPDAAPPNAALFAYHDRGTSVFTTTVGSAPNRTFVVEWRAAQLPPSQETRFEALLGENGSISLQYLSGTQEASLTIGTENQTGTDGTAFDNYDVPIGGPHKQMVHPQTRIDFQLADSEAPNITTQTPPPGPVREVSVVTASFDDWLGAGSSISLTGPGGTVVGTSELSTDFSRLAFTPQSPLPEGLHTVSITAIDELGNTSNLGWSFTVDKKGPQVTVTSPGTGATVSKLFGIDVTAADDAGIALVRWNVATHGGVLTFDSATGTYKGIWDTTNLPNGPYNLLVTATDAVGNSSAITVPVTVSNNYVFYPPDSYTLSYGIHSVGDTASLAYDDSNELTTISAPTVGLPNPQSQYISWTATATTQQRPTDSIFQLHTYLDRRYTRSIDNVHELVYMYNYRISQWAKVGDSWFLTNGSKLTTMVPGGSPNDYVGLDGSVRLRVDAFSAWPFVSHADLLNFRFTL